jgi:hypothetical protein
LWVAQEAGYRLGQWRRARVASEKEAPVGAMVGPILGLLAFMLAFTFGLAANRYEARRQAVLDEANAIGTAYLRTKLLPEPQRSETARLLREYVDVRVRAVNEAKIAEGIARSEELQQLLWAEAVKATESDKGTPAMKSLFVQSLNEVINLHARRMQVGVRGRIPTSIWAGLFFVALLGMTAVGYQAGLSAPRRTLAGPGMIVAFASVFLLIADLDRSQEGFLNVSQQALIDVQKSIKT